MEIIVISVIFLVILVGLYFMFKERFLKQFNEISEELRLFKKEKERLCAAKLEASSLFYRCFSRKMFQERQIFM